MGGGNSFLARAGIITALFVTSITARAASCPSFEAARDFYFSGRVADSLAAARCLKARYPNDLDVRRLLSDIYWWQGNVEASVLEAREATKLPHFDADPETAIHLSRRASSVKLSAQYDRLFGGSQTGNEAHGELDWRFFGRDHLIAGYQRLQRIFLGTPAAIDSLFNFEYSRLQGERSYILFKGGFSTTHVFSPVWTAGLEPHYTLGDDSDLGLEARYSHYVGQEVALAAPSWRHVYGDWTTTARVFVTVANSVLPSALGSVAWAMHPRLEPRFTVAGGKTLEQVNLTDKFYSLAAELAWHVRPNLIARVLGSIYRGEVRTENRVGVGGEWLF